MLAERGNRALGDDPAVGDDGEAVAQAFGLVHIVGGQENRLAQLSEASNHLPGVAAGGRIEAAGRLVEEEQVGVAGQGKREVEAAHLSAGETADEALALLIEPDDAQDFVERTRMRVVAAKELDHLLDGEEALDAGTLEDDADAGLEGALVVLRVVA